MYVRITSFATNPPTNQPEDLHDTSTTALNRRFADSSTPPATLMPMSGHTRPGVRS
jgi:hypothetical protein